MQGSNPELLACFIEHALERGPT
uniref:Uncharacterized protein n=1 Tax=Arundo donax TaxID=35708 RepID=A0A0A9H5N6_ARUDO